MRAVYAEWGKGNLAAGASLFDPLVLFLPLPDFPAADHYLGMEGVREYTRELLGVLTNYTLTADEFIEAGDSVVVASRSRGIGTESGALTELRHFQVWTFRGGIAIRLEHFRDRAEALEVAGLSE